MSETTALLAKIGRLRVGESITFPVEKTNYIKSACSTYGLVWNKKFRTKVNRAERTITKENLDRRELINMNPK